jgi:hypothetical protein
MAFAGPNTQFKMTARKQRQTLFKAGNNYMQVYNAVRSYKLTPPVLGPVQTTQSDITFPSKL